MIRCSLFSIVFLLGTFSQLSGALNAFLKISSIEGESETEGHVGEIDITGISWGIFRPKNNEGVPGSANFGDIIVSKLVDKSTPGFLHSVASGNQLGECVITLRRLHSSGTEVDYLKITMTNVAVSSYSMGGTDEEGVPTENVSLLFRTVEVIYTIFDGNGDPTGIEEMTWDLATNTP